MPRADGATLRAWRRSQGWDVRQMAVQLRRVAAEAGQQVAARDALVRMIHGWERGQHRITERYELLYYKALGTVPDDGDLASGAVPAEPTLLRVLIQERRWRLFRTFEAQFARAARELAEREQEKELAKVSVSERTFERWYSGDVRTMPRADASRVLEHMFGYPVQELLGPADPEPVIESDPVAETSRIQIWPGRKALTPDSLFLPSVNSDLATASEWPVWFGIKIAHLISLVDNWDSTMQLNSLQILLHREILLFDAAGPGDDSIRAVHALSRRQALVALAALPLTLTGSSSISVGRLSAPAATDFFLSRCSASLTACWHLLRGSDLPVVYQTLSSFLLALEGIAQKQSGYQQAAARLASQAHRICGIVALHRNQLRVRYHHCNQALYYATVASDAASQASALISLASTYFYDSNPSRAAEIYEQASGLEPAMSPLQRSRVYAELSVVYGQLSREKDAIRATGLAEELYPDNPEQDRSFLYAEFTPASLSLESGLAYAALAEQYPGRGYEDKAAEIFGRVDRMTSAVPDRIRFEIINHQARTAVLRGDLDAFEMYLNRGLDGVVLLGSGQRRREMQAALGQARKVWPHEARVMALSDGAHILTRSSGIGGSD
jgi:tetratricopeptide (TPR) repeat protein/transcriptional regulator with XRE-family HTH domain